MKKADWEIEWSDALSVGNPMIDAEHQYFILLINELNRAIADRQNKDEIIREMNQLLTEARYHFAHEEQLFAEKGFPEAQAHCKHHSDLLGRFSNSLKEFTEVDYSPNWIDNGLAIKDLMVSHILNVDSRYVEYLRSDSALSVSVTG